MDRRERGTIARREEQPAPSDFPQDFFFFFQSSSKVFVSCLRRTDGEKMGKRREKREREGKGTRLAQLPRFQLFAGQSLGFPLLPFFPLHSPSNLVR